MRWRQKKIISKAETDAIDPDNEPEEIILESLHRSLQQVRDGKVHLISELWDGIEVYELTNFEILFSDDQDTTVVDKNLMFFTGNNYAIQRLQNSQFSPQRISDYLHGI
jgi:hypothetical protein